MDTRELVKQSKVAMDTLWRISVAMVYMLLGTATVLPVFHFCSISPHKGSSKHSPMDLHEKSLEILQGTLHTCIVVYAIQYTLLCIPLIKCQSSPSVYNSYGPRWTYHELEWLMSTLALPAYPPNMMKYDNVIQPDMHVAPHVYSWEYACRDWLSFCRISHKTVFDCRVFGLVAAGTNSYSPKWIEPVSCIITSFPPDLSLMCTRYTPHYHQSTHMITSSCVNAECLWAIHF